MISTQYRQDSVTPASDVRVPRLVLSLESGFMLCCGINWDGLWWEAPHKHWNMDVLEALLTEVLPWHGVAIVDMSLTAEEINGFCNTDELLHFKGRLAKVVVYGECTSSGYRARENFIGNVGATLHILSRDYMQSIGRGDLRVTWQRALSQLADCHIELPDHYSVPGVLGRGCESAYDEIVLVDIETADGGEVKLDATAYTCKK